MRAALERLNQRANAIWPAEEVERLRVECQEAAERGIVPPALLARIQSDEVLAAAWREFCRVCWLQFYAEVHGFATEHDYFSQA